MAPSSPHTAASSVANNSRMRVAEAAALRSASRPSSRMRMALICSRSTSNTCLFSIRIAVMASGSSRLPLRNASKPSSLSAISGVMVLRCSRILASRMFWSRRCNAAWINGVACS
jgi:hypothetical protein